MTPARLCLHSRLNFLFSRFCHAQTEAERDYLRPMIDDVLQKMGLKLPC